MDAPLHAGAQVVPSKEAVNYLANTLRLKVGDQVELFNGRDGAWAAELAEVSKKSVTLRVLSQRAAQKPSPDIWLAFAPVKNEKIDYTVRRATELGVSALLPVMTQRTVVSRVNEERLAANVVEAAESSERLDVPVLHTTQDLKKLLGSWPQDRTLFFCDESGVGEPAIHVLPKMQKMKAGVLIGPEGGFTPEEQETLRRLPFVKSMTLGPRVLRAETAALVALTHVVAWLGDGEEKP